MLSRALLPAFTSFLVVSGLLTFLSCDIDAKQEKKPAQSAKASGPYRPSKCCMAGYIYCPTGGPDGCDCCGTNVKATIMDYDAGKYEGHLKIEGLTKEDGKTPDPVPFYVENKGVRTQLETMQGKTDQFIIKLKAYEYKKQQSPPPPFFHPNADKLDHWHGTRYECEQIGDDNGAGGKMTDRTAEFIEGWKLSGFILAARVKLEELVPTYAPERDGDKRK